MENTNLESVLPNAIVGIHYTLRDADGLVLDSTEGVDPLFYIHGQNQIVLGLEQALENRKVNDKFEVKLEPFLAYGEHNPNLTSVVKKNAFPKEAELKLSAIFQFTDSNGNSLPVMVTKIEGDDVTIDANHPLAGKELLFNVEVVSIRQASQEELSQRIVNG